MNFILDSDTCSTHLKGDRRVATKIALHRGQLAISALTAGELYVWTLRRRAPARRLLKLIALLDEVAILPVDDEIAREFGRRQAAFYDAGQPRPVIDLFIAATALVHQLVVVTHNTADFQSIPGLKLDDWLV